MKIPLGLKILATSRNTSNGRVMYSTDTEQMMARTLENAGWAVSGAGRNSTGVPGILMGMRTHAGNTLVVQPNSTL